MSKVIQLQPYIDKRKEENQAIEVMNYMHELFGESISLKTIITEMFDSINNSSENNNIIHNDDN